MFDDTSVSEIFDGENLPERFDPEHFDVVIVGAGLSGIGAACHLQRECPDRSYVILEGRADLGGTWDLFRYPGVRSDSDMHTLGYEFKPWTHEKSIADGPSILAYLRETAAEYGIDAPHPLRPPRRRAQSWSSDDGRWTVHGARHDDGDAVELTCSFLFMCSGYYSYKGGYAAELAGHRALRGHGRAPAVLAGRPRLRAASGWS